MQQQVVYVPASESNPNTDELDAICRRMAAQGLVLEQVSASQGDGGATVGLWLFFGVGAATASAGLPGGAGRFISTVPPVESSNAMVGVTQAALFWWQEVRAKKGLGLSLTLTGLSSVIIGTILHFALRHNVIDTTLHLGYFFGVVGLFLFLIGLVILF